jgi:hypothetical protein
MLKRRAGKQVLPGAESGGGGRASGCGTFGVVQRPHPLPPTPHTLLTQGGGREDTQLQK